MMRNHLEESVEDLSMQVFDLMESTENAIAEDSGEALKKKADKRWDAFGYSKESI